MGSSDSLKGDLLRGEPPFRSQYMAWAKTQSQARFGLAASNMAPFPLAELDATIDNLEINGPTTYGYPPLQAALAAKCEVAEDSVLTAIGTTQANHLVMAALLSPGDHLLIEHPVYEPMVALARQVGAEVDFFTRRAETGFGVDPEEVERKVTPRTRLIAITDLHNPSSARLDEPTLAALAGVARRAGARLLVDEVYLEMAWVEGDRSRPGVASAFHLGPEVVATSSLTKAYGLSGLRCGWVLAEPSLVCRMWELADLFVGTPAHPAELLSVLALARLGKIADRAQEILVANRALVGTFLDGRDDLEIARPRFGSVLFPRWAGGDVEPLCRLLREKHETAVVPGRFFGAPEHFRFGIGGSTEVLRAGLERLGAALDELR